MGDSTQAFTSIPDEVDLSWAESFHNSLKSAVEGQRPLEDILSEDAAACILARTACLLDKEPTVVDVVPSEDLPVIIVGDTHGQFLDVLFMLNYTQAYQGGKIYIFNGDLVDRGSWGVELFLSVAVLKLADPSRCIMLRGNHESHWCTKLYGFKKELESKYPPRRRPQSSIRKLNIGSFVTSGVPAEVFKLMPLAAVVAQTTLVLHGGLWRRPPAKKRKAGASGRRAGAKSAKRVKTDAPSVSVSEDAEWMPSSGNGADKIILGSLKDLRNSGKGGADPLGQFNTNAIATDVLWSDPVQEPGLAWNDSRGVGLLFGPDVTKQFLESHKLRMIVRSHEGPDARTGRDDMQGMDTGLTVDHKSEAGVLVTVFSAPDYPQHQVGDKRYQNEASVLELKHPSYSEYKQIKYSAVPRPPAPCFYDLDVPGSDDELNIGADDVASDISDAAASRETSANGSEVDDEKEGLDAEDEVTESFLNVTVQDTNKECCMKQEECAVLGSRCMAAVPVSMADATNAAACSEALPRECTAVETEPCDAVEHSVVREDASMDLDGKTVGCKAKMSAAAIACAVP